MESKFLIPSMTVILFLLSFKVYSLSRLEIFYILVILLLDRER